ncbi:MAG: NAD(P)H-binding protein [Acidimicrobiia bacterium]|nr:NAD(P)H-binding protein [Acidimicrobiia bacterium]NNK91187.1 NAD(P)H-binding protein [Acidimicrobiia bacterium]
MPVIIVGADSPQGNELVAALRQDRSEVRAFITEPAAGDGLRALGAKVAIGDVTDASHVGGAALNAFSAVLLIEAATDDRERSFAGSIEEVLASWAEAVSEAGITRVILVAPPGLDTGALTTAAPEFVRVAPSGDVVAAVVAANEAASV